ncbi:MAG TPA: SurA N-terminal domain-containing protein [Caulobacteraceae bacterium]|nr:SurA N-terminal domain-containing protein [Caulobacteraceae bacterium]
MTGSLRSSARNPIAVALMGALILVFLILGVGGGRFPDAFRTVNADAVVSVGGHSMSSHDFEKIWDQQKQKFQQQTGQDLTNQFLVENGVDEEILDQSAREQAAMEMVERSGVVPGPDLVDDEIKKLPWAFDKVTGQFSQQQFTQVLASQGMTPRQAQAEITDELAMRHFGLAAAGGAQAPFLYAALTGAQGAEARDVSYFMMGLNAVPKPAPPTDAQLAAFMKEHASQLMQPETRIITLVKFSGAALAPTIKIDPAQVAKEFAFRRDSLSQPEKRTIVMIPVKTAADGASAARRLSAGEDPSTVAKSLGVEAVSYADKPQSAIPDRKLGQAAFALKSGAVNGPVTGDLGLAAIKVVNVTPGVTATLANATPQIEADLRQKQAADLAYQQSEKFDEARQAGASDADAAKKAGVAAITLGPVTAQGADSDGKPNPLLNDKILKAAFAAPAGQEGDLEDAGPSEYFALKVEKVLPPSLPALADKREQLARVYLSTTYVNELKAKAVELMALAKKTGNLDQAASQVGEHVAIEKDMTRLKAQQYQAYGREFLENVFAAKPGAVFAAGGQKGVFIAKVDQVRPGDPKLTAQLTAAIRARASQGYAEDLLNAFETAALAKLKATKNRALALQTINVDPNSLPKDSAKPGSAPAK